jgi:hypothetical protein
MIKVLNSWKHQKNLIIAEIEYSGEGLFKGTQLVSKNSTNVWTVNSRLIFNHTMNNQKRFKGETESYLSLRFVDEDARVKSHREILDKESAQIYQYLIEPVNHVNKPKENEELIIEK